MTPAGLSAFGSVTCVWELRAQAEADAAKQHSAETKASTERRRIESTRIIAADTGQAAGLTNGEASRAPVALPPEPESHGIAPIGFTVLLLVLATTSQGAFAISRWAPLTLFVIALLAGVLVFRGRFTLRSRAIRVSLAGIWGLAAWSLLSMTWADSSASALVGADQTMLYAGIATLPFVLPLSRRSLAGAGWALTAGISLVAVYIELRLLVHGAPEFLAGRLNGPIDYRNATALLFALPVWPLLVAAASRTFARGTRALSFALALLCLSLVFLTQSRGILLGLGAGACVALTLGPDRVRRAWMAALAVAGIVLASHWLLRPFHAFDGGAGITTGHDIAIAAQAAALLTVAGFVVGLLIAVFDSGLRANTDAMRNARRAARGALIAGGLGLLAAAIVAMGNPVTFAHHKWDQFRDLNAATPTTTRYGSVGGQRYDLWRVAIDEFRTAPLNGVGAQNYSFGYYKLRGTNRNLSDPHSLVFALLAEDGIVGILLFLTFLGGIVALVLRRWRVLDRQARRHAVGPLAAGAVLLGQSAVDWMWLIPGLSAVGICALAFGAGQVASPERAPTRFRESLPRSAARRQFALRSAGAVALILCAAAVLSVYLSDAYIQRARAQDTDPAAELSAARTAARLDPWLVTPHYLESSALETMGNRPASFAQLNDALRLEPANFATLGVLGDFEARGGDDALARSYYRRALARDPLDTGLQQLARFGQTRVSRRRVPR